MKSALMLACLLALPACDDADTDGRSADAAPMAAEDAGRGGSGGMGGAGAVIDYAGESNLGACGTNPQDADRYAIIGFWRSDDCSGDPIATNAFPVNSTAGCYCWPGNSGENSADSFACDPGAGTVTIVQYNSLSCGEGDDTPTPKTFHVDACRQDIPPTLYAKVIDPGPCR